MVSHSRACARAHIENTFFIGKDAVVSHSRACARALALASWNRSPSSRVTVSSIDMYNNDVGKRFMK